MENRHWTWIGLLASAALAGGGAWFWFGWTGPTPPSRSRTILSLKVDRAGTDFRVTWDPASPAVLAATTGTLSISDGGFQKDLELDREQLRQAAVLYSPAGDDVTFSLKLVRPQAEPVVESVRLLSDKPPAP